SRINLATLRLVATHMRTFAGSAAIESRAAWHNSPAVRPSATSTGLAGSAPPSSQVARWLKISVRSRSVVIRTGVDHRPVISRSGRGLRPDQSQAAIRHVRIVDDLDTAFFGEEQHVLEHVPAVRPDQHKPGQPAQEHPGRLAGSRLDQMLARQAELRLQPAD